jgi:hypothetical protein
MALDLEQDDARDSRGAYFRGLLAQIDSDLASIQQQVDLLTTFRQEVTDNTEGIYVAEDLPKVTLRLAEKRDEIVAWANGL